MRRRAVILLLLLGAAASADAQHHAAQPPASPPAWQWTWDGNVFAGFNYQRRRFTDFRAWESQNWFMLHGERQSVRDAWRVHLMGTLEPLTIQDLGSPQVFQTGETFEGIPLVDYQHPHDLLMAAGATWRRSIAGAALVVGADLVGEPALGPTAFMHRESARDNPQAPLGHHQLDATHVTYGVVRAGVDVGSLTVEGSVFQGREPDERRTDVDLGPLDSYAARVSYRREAWRAQVSAGWLNEPEPYELLDVLRLTASIEYTGARRSRPFAWTAAWGQNREGGASLDAYLLEGSWRFGRADTLYARGEHVTKVIIGRAALHAAGFRHPHQYSRIGALTGGYLRDITSTRFGRFGVGADLTGYAVPPELEEPYGSPLSLHVFLRWRAPQPTHGHVH